jgi:nascent polypeptide-associated complex subunit beta
VPDLVENFDVEGEQVAASEKKDTLEDVNWVLRLRGGT